MKVMKNKIIKLIKKVITNEQREIKNKIITVLIELIYIEFILELVLHTARILLV